MSGPRKDLTSLTALRSIALPPHLGSGGFDHAAVDRTRERVYVAHTANDAVDVLDSGAGTYVRSIPGLKGAAGVLVDEPSGTVFTSNRGEDTVGIWSPGAADHVAKVPVGVRPNGLAYNPDRGILLCANVGNPTPGGLPNVTLVDARAARVLATVPMPGRTRWAIFDPDQRLFFVNIADPFRIVVLDPDRPERATRHFAIPARGPHGLDLDRARGRLYCACDEGALLAVDSRSGETIDRLELTGPPDVIFLDPARSRLYVAVGDPGVIDVIDVATWTRVETVPTEPGAHTLALDETRHHIYAFLPQTHRALVLADTS